MNGGDAAVVFGAGAFNTRGVRKLENSGRVGDGEPLLLSAEPPQRRDGIGGDAPAAVLVLTFTAVGADVAPSRLMLLLLLVATLRRLTDSLTCCEFAGAGCNTVVDRFIYTDL